MSKKSTRIATSPAQGPPPSAQGLVNMAQGLQVLAGWYREAMGLPVGAGGDAAGMLRDFVDLRAAWENREASVLAALMTAQCKAQAATPAPVPGRLRALLIDDEADILVVVGAFLESSGFDVLRASSGDAALAIIAAGERIDLLVTDYAMPGLSGKDLAIAARGLVEGLRTLIITGYPEANALSDLPEGIALLAKPFRRAELSLRVRLLFGQEAARV